MADTAINIQTELDSRATTSTKTSYGAWAKAGLVFGSSIAAFTLAKTTGALSWVAGLFSGTNEANNSAVTQYTAFVTEQMTLVDAPDATHIALFGDIVKKDQVQLDLLDQTIIKTTADKSQKDMEIGIVAFEELKLAPGSTIHQTKPALQSNILTVTTQFPASVSLNALDGVNGFLIVGSQLNTGSIKYASSSKDINGDGIADIVLGNYGANNAFGIAYIILGKNGTWTSSFSLSDLNGTNGFMLLGSDRSDYIGYYVDNSGDCNGDGIADLVIGYGDRDIVQVIYGHTGIWPKNIIIGNLNATQSFSVSGFGPTGSGIVSNAGDVNGDGIADLVVSDTDPSISPNIDISYLVFGTNKTLTTQPNRYTFSANGYINNAGDVNGDGIADIIIGDPGDNSAVGIDNLQATGASYLIFGHNGTWNTSFYVSNIDGTNGVTFLGINVDDKAGYCVSNAGDINADGLADIVIGSPGANAAYIIFGSKRGWNSPFPLANLNGINGFTITGTNVGHIVTNAGDLNGDYVADIVISAYSSTYVIFGHAGPWPSVFSIYDLNGRNGFAINAASNAINNGGDINGDGLPDLFVGSNSVPGGFVIFGDAPTTMIINDTALNLYEGSTVLLSNSYLDFNSDNPRTHVQFKVFNVKHGYFSIVLQPFVAINNFTDQQLSAMQVQFIHDGTCNVPSYQLSMNAGKLMTTPVLNVSFNFIPAGPTILQNRLYINQGQTIILTAQNLNSTDPAVNVNAAELTFAVSNVQHGSFTVTGDPGAVLTQFTQQQINAGGVQFIADGSSSAPSYAVTVTDSCGLTSGPQIASIDFNLPPVIVNNQLTITEGTTVILTGSNLSATTGISGGANALQFSVRNVQHGFFAFTNAPTVAITQFTQGDISNGRVQFVHDGSCSSPLYSVQVTDPRAAISAISSATVNFNPIFPIINTNHFSIKQGQTLLVSADNLAATDKGDTDSDLRFRISSLRHGRFLPASFTQQDINVGLVQFIHDDTETAPSFSAVVQDSCGLSSDSISANIDFNLATTGSTAAVASSDNTVRNSIIGGVASGAVGLGFFALRTYLQRKANESFEHASESYKSSQVKRQEDFYISVLLPVAAKIKATITITSCGYISDDGMEDYIGAVMAILTEVEKQGINLEISQLTPVQQNTLINEIAKQTRLQTVGQRGFGPWLTSFFCAEITPKTLEHKSLVIAEAVRAALVTKRHASISGFGLSPSAGGSTMPLFSSTKETTVSSSAEQIELQKMYPMQ